MAWVSYAVLHDPASREKCAIDLSREFRGFRSTRTPGSGRNGGRKLMDLHIGYESAPPPNSSGLTGRTRRRAELACRRIYSESRQEGGRIIVDSETTRPPFRQRRGSTALASVLHWSGFSTSTRKRSPRTRPSARSSKPTDPRTTKEKSSTC